MKNIILLLFTSLIFSCTITPPESMSNEPEETKGPIPFLIDTLLLDKGSYCDIETPLIYEDNLIVMITNWETKEGWINCYDKTTLELRWRWQEALDEFGAPARGFGFVSHIYDGILAIAHSNLSYGIDIKSGNTLWKNRDPDTALSAIFGLKNKISNTRRIDPQSHHTIITANLELGVWTEVYSVLKNDSLNIDTGSGFPFEFNNKEYLTFVTGKWSSSPPLEVYWLNLYNLTENRLEWTSDTIPLNHPLSGTPGRQPKFEDGQILLANDAIYSYNVEDGSLEWWEWYGNSFVISNTLTAANGLVYGNNDSQFMVGLDVHTGEEIFNTVTGGSTSKIAYHDDKCYMASVTIAGTNRLMILDAQTGQILENERAPFREEDAQWVFERAIGVDPETGLVYTGDHRYLLVYDFTE